MKEPEFFGPENTLPAVDQLFMFVSRDAVGREGVCAFRDGLGQWFPLITADERILPALKSRAREIAAASKLRIILLRFTAREEIEVIE